jgi:hypothetical protein
VLAQVEEEVVYPLVEVPVQVDDLLLGQRVVQLLDGRVLAEPVVADKHTIAVRPAPGPGHPVALVAVDDAEVLLVVVVVPHVVRHSRLLVRPVIRPLGAVGVARARRAVLPALEHVRRLLAALADEEARVPHDLAPGVAVVRDPGVLGGGEHDVLVDVPEAHEPLEGQADVLEDGVGVEEDDDVVRLEGLAHDGHLDPCAVSIFVLRGADEAVVVAVDEGWRVR